jgi:hypothetical protein
MKVLFSMSNLKLLRVGLIGVALSTASSVVGSGGSGGGGRDRVDRVDRPVREVRTSGDGSGGGSKVREPRTSGGSGGGSSGSGGSDGGGSGSGTSGGGSGTSGSGSSGSGSSGSGSSGSGSNSGSGSSGSGSGSSESGSNSGSENSGSGSNFEEMSSGSASKFDLAARERPDFDDKGFPARRGEVVSIDLSPREIKRARDLGFKVIDDIHLKALDMHLVRLRAPEGTSAAQALTTLRNTENGLDGSGGEYDFDHFYGVSGDADVSARGTRRTVPQPAATKGRLLIGLIDTAVAVHPSLRAVQVESQNFATSSLSAGAPPSTHGTAVASILARYGAARLVSANIFSADVRPYASADGIARAINWMVGRGVPVINISIAGPSNRLVDRVISAATAKGFLIVAAAGNGGPTALPAYPAASPGAIAVTAVDSLGRVYAHANRGNYVTISALGVGVPAAAPDGSLKAFSGTSFAAPVVAAYLAGCIGKARSTRAHACVIQMETQARDIGAAGRDPVYGFGMLVP